MKSNREVFRTRGFSLIELLVVMVITLILVSVAAFYFDEYVYKGRLSKTMQDLDMFRTALQLYDSTENSPFCNYNYQGGGEAATFGFAYSTALIANYYPAGAPELTAGGSSTAWTNYHANSLKSLLGRYLLTLPDDPFNFPYVINSSAGYIASLGADNSTAGNHGQNKDIIMYYINLIPVLVDIVVNDTDASQTITTGDFLDFKFNKDVTNPDVVLVAAHLMYTDENQNVDKVVTQLITDNGTSFTNTASANGAIRVRNDGRTLRFYISVAPGENLIGKKVKFNTAGGANAFSDSISDNNPYFLNSATGKSRTIDLINGNPYVKVRLAGTF